MMKCVAAISFVMVAQLSAAQGGELHIYEHNGSVVEVFIVADHVKITYRRPKSSLESAGVREGNLLFEGQFDGDRLEGQAFAFKAGCKSVAYDVIGRAENKSIILDGPGPVREASGCKVVRYSATSPHAHLVFKYSATHH